MFYYLSFVKEECDVKPENEESSTVLYNSYKNYCIESGLKPVAQRTFVMQITNNSDVTRFFDNTSKRRILKGIKLDTLTH